jgi:hypothetical protein
MLSLSLRKEIQVSTKLSLSHTHTNINTGTQTNTHTYSYLHTDTHTCARTRMPTWIHVLRNMDIHTCRNMFTKTTGKASTQNHAYEELLDDDDELDDELDELLLHTYKRQCCLVLRLKVVLNV